MEGKSTDNRRVGKALGSCEWDQRWVRRVAVFLSIHILVWILPAVGVVVLLDFSCFWLIPIAALLIFAEFVAMWHFRKTVRNFPVALTAYENGLYLQTGRLDEFHEWSQVQGFRGVGRSPPRLRAARFTTGGLASSLQLIVDGKSVPLWSPMTGDLGQLVSIIEEHLRT